jgi:hypothetical protein
MLDDAARDHGAALRLPFVRLGGRAGTSGTLGWVGAGAGAGEGRVRYLGDEVARKERIRPNNNCCSCPRGMAVTDLRRLSIGEADVDIEGNAGDVASRCACDAPSNARPTFTTVA